MSLDQSVLNAKLRTEGGKGPARRLRTTGTVPAVIYGRGATPVSLSIDPLALRKAIATPHKLNTVITVKVDGQPDRIVLLKEVQQHPVGREILHADFQELRLDQPTRVEVPVILVGKAVGTGEGGILTQVTRSIQIICLPGAIPVNLQVDVTPLKISQSLHESDIVLPEGIKLGTRKNETIAVVAAPAAEEVAAVAAAVPGAAAAGAAAAGAPAAAGAAPAAGAKGAAAPAAGGKAAPAAAAKPAGKK